ncbi:uncharacterized protein METZ01_LOCUS502538 [marine metagenome]|uniref:ApaG domain-containing protein n=1 Tax=marine metagenome TaxID=408172 RepID=A0A383DZD2_9ZZZZ
MSDSLGSITVTEGIRIEVRPEYLSEYSAPERNKFFYGYHIRISNEGDRWAKLLTRHWIIINADGDRQDVEGKGVIGEQPELHPGEVHEYDSLCPIDTDWGTMEGSYTMIREDEEEFKAVITRFYLAVPKEVQIEES